MISRYDKCLAAGMNPEHILSKKLRPDVDGGSRTWARAAVDLSGESASALSCR
jgi:hypothetical protein